jgi:conjugal transfer/type IV secretion protein DotA/TraY
MTKMINAATGGSLFSESANDDEPGVLALLAIKMLLLGLVVLFLIYPMGIMLAFYLPMIPFLIWVIAGINWLVSTMSIMVGAPLWAAAHSLPDGEGFAGARGQEGYLLLLNVILRPTLMVIGFFLAFIGIRMLGVFLYELFMVSQAAMNANFSRGLVTVLVMIFLFGMIVIVCAQKIFTLIVLFPDIILNFVGKYLPGGGESGDVHKINSMFDRVKSQATPRLPGR